MSNSDKTHFQWVAGNKKKIAINILLMLVFFGSTISTYSMSFFDKINILGSDMVNASSSEKLGKRVFSKLSNNSGEDLSDTETSLKTNYDEYKIHTFLGATPNDSFVPAVITYPQSNLSIDVTLLETSIGKDEIGNPSSYLFYQNFSSLRTITGVYNEDSIIVNKKYAYEWLAANTTLKEEEFSSHYYLLDNKSANVTAYKSDGSSEDLQFKIVNVIDFDTQKNSNDGLLYKKYFGEDIFLFPAGGIKRFAGLSLYNSYHTNIKQNGKCAVELFNYARSNNMDFTFDFNVKIGGINMGQSLDVTFDNVIIFSNSFWRYFTLSISIVVSIITGLSILSIFLSIFNNSLLKEKYSVSFMLSLIFTEIAIFFIYIFCSFIANFLIPTVYPYVFPGVSLFFDIFSMAILFGSILLLQRFIIKKVEQN
ncbi:MAG: hypothetical protein LBM03_01505 [Erysipelotrichaceae bacterium]|jgi:flagellar basal body-associated protein FliL|nr:hypothetical protein [Erysipelotrichaceae bacterium]